MKAKVVILVITLSSLLACNGGGGGGSPQIPTPPPQSTSFLPLNISVSDLNNNPLPDDRIDVYKIGQVTKYKLTFTNPNSFSVTPPKSNGGDILGAESNWFENNNLNDIPGTFGEITGNYYKTPNADDCFNVGQLSSGQSCSFYTIAQYAFNTTPQENFSYPIAYVINQISDPSNKLVVQQCQKRYPGAVPEYDCSNETKPGYAKQFIKYRLVSTTTAFPYPGYQGFDFSNDGNYMAYCTQTSPTTCTKQRVTYNSASNTLTFSGPLASFTAYTDLYTPSGLLSADGVTFFGSLLINAGDYTLVNSTNPTQFTGSTGTNNVSDLFEFQGLDNSIIINNTGFGRAFKYKQTVSNFISDIKIDGNFATYVYGTTSDGTLITEDNKHNLRCANSTNGINYTSHPMANFTFPTTYADYVHNMNNNSQRAFRIHNVFYGYQDFAQTDANGKSYIRQGAFFKINADNSHCSIAIADANTIAPSDITFEYGASVYNDYVNIGSKLTSVNNTVLGFN